MAGAVPIPFIDLAAQQRRIRGRLEQAIERVLAHGQYIHGPEVAELEGRLAAFCGARHAVACASGTDALLLPLLALGIGPGQAVFVPSFTFVATAEAVALLGATPFFVDVGDDFLLDPEGLAPAIDEARRLGLEPRAVIPVDLFGHPADYGAIEAVAASQSLCVIADAAQGFGGARNGRRVGTLARFTATSFFPAKPLGCYGDGGAIFTDEREVVAVLTSLRVHGQGADRYDNVRVGINGRLDTLQAAILIEKLAILEDEIAARNRVAVRYSEGLRDMTRTPHVVPGAVSAWAQYTIRLEHRDAVAAALQTRQVPTAIHYPKPLHLQGAYLGFPRPSRGLPVAERLAREVLSLPMHPYLEPLVQDRIISAVREAIREQGA
ncbi:MAG: DegT/DnrJ/EryC1/StrS family aminotransferase [Gammaproteobacteria bacterium]